MINYISLKNFKIFDEIELELGSLTLLSGLNGSGKSTIVQALGILRQSHEAGFLFEGGLALSGELVDIGTGRDLLCHNFDRPELTIGLTGSDDGNDFDLQWSAEVIPDADVLKCHRHPEIAEYLFRKIFLDQFQFLRADRITPLVTFPKSQYASRKRRFLGARGEYTAHFLREFGEEIQTAESIRWPGEKDTASLGAQVNGWMQEFSPGARVEAVSVPMTDLVRLVFSYRGEGSSYGDSLRSTNVGFGLTHSLPVIVACLAASAGSLLVVENPEAQLHPHGQAVLGRLMALTAANGVQLIVESHSDHILNGIRVAVKEGCLSSEDVKLHFFSRQSNHTSKHETPVLMSDGRLSYWPSYFFDEWEKNLDSLLG